MAFMHLKTPCRQHGLGGSTHVAAQIQRERTVSILNFLSQRELESGVGRIASDEVERACAKLPGPGTRRLSS
ncbi:hypothetical protein E2C01_031443 [Portunus trituberculatus]|uniref:Uncharacterized protein n=1 Tax=Portunus trituberculatus TaxID=210409 RepID=A0A5B7EY50_PORTR|nr:hypothetical protein [Portunus trituberculatus]